MSVTDLRCEQCLSRLDIELGDLAIFELQEVYLITHTLDVEDAVSRYFYHLLACRLCCVEDPQDSSRRRSNKEVARDGIDPNSPRDSARRHIEQHLVQSFLTSEQDYLPVLANTQEDVLSWIIDNIFDWRCRDTVTVRAKSIPVERLIIIDISIMHRDHSINSAHQDTTWLTGVPEN